MRLAVLVPAHNEAALIAATVRAARAAAAPPAAVFVVADHCEDATAAAARTAGARVFERHEGPAGKGAAIAWFLRAAGDELASVDGLVILDADSRVRPGALAALGAALARGATAAQGFVWPEPADASPAPMLAAYSEWVSQALDDRLRWRLGWPVPLRGTGMALPLPVLRELAPRLRTRVEDVELALLVLARGGHIAFVPEAVVVDPKPLGGGRVARQRARWLQGQREVWRAYHRLILRLLATGGPGRWWLLGALLVKPRTGIVAAKGAALLLVAPFATRPLGRRLAGAAAALLLVDVLYYLVGLAVVPPGWRGPMARALAQAPVYLVMWSRALLLSLASRERWLRARD
ncbi:MAG TPA: glycosyltransferase [Chloroflexota bacterium]|nr:glycosyltransferase [Chloroflexota bacterium]